MTILPWTLVCGRRTKDVTFVTTSQCDTILTSSRIVFLKSVRWLWPGRESAQSSAICCDSDLSCEHRCASPECGQQCGVTQQLMLGWPDIRVVVTGFTRTKGALKLA